MKYRISCILILTLFFIKTFGQAIKEKELIGTWKVIKVKAITGKLTKDEDERLELLKKAMLSSTFIFGADKSFSFNISLEDLQIDKAHWKLDTSKNIILIAELGNTFNKETLLMDISVKREEDKIFFLIAENLFELEVKKQ